MNLLGINYNLRIASYNMYNSNNCTRRRTFSLAEPSCDVFVYSKDKVVFCGKTKNSNENEFKVRFPKTFFQKLVKEGVPCAYTGLPLISREDYEELKNSQDLQKRSAVAIRRLKQYKNSMFPVEKQVFTILERESKRHPNLKLYELLQLKYNSSEKILISKQAATLDKINMIARGLPKEDFRKVRKFINESFDKIFVPDPLPEERFKRKDFIIGLSEIKLSNQNIKNKMLKVAEELPQSSDSVHSFIIKYAQPYKIKYEKGVRRLVERSDDELGLRLISPSVVTDDHIYPNSLFKVEDEARKNNEEWAKDLSSLRVTILTAYHSNFDKGNDLIDDFIRKSKYDVGANIQKHIDRLIEIDEKWLKEGNIKDSAKLADYIIVLKEEFERRSDRVKVDISKLDEILEKIKTAEGEYNDDLKDNELRVIMPYSNSRFQCRKEQKHTPRYSK